MRQLEKVRRSGLNYIIRACSLTPVFFGQIFGRTAKHPPKKNRVFGAYFFTVTLPCFQSSLQGVFIFFDMVHGEPLYDARLGFMLGLNAALNVPAHLVFMPTIQVLAHHIPVGLKMPGKGIVNSECNGCG
jgi:hypothetical protein